MVSSQLLHLALALICYYMSTTVTAFCPMARSRDTTCITAVNSSPSSRNKLIRWNQMIPSKLLLQAVPNNNNSRGDDKNNDDDDDDEEEDRDDEEGVEPISPRERFYRDDTIIMGELLDDDDGRDQTKRQQSRKKKTTKRPHDNRDQLPFLVQVLTPPEQPYKHQILQRQQQRQQTTSNNNNKKKGNDKKKKNNNNDDATSSSSSSSSDIVIGETLGEFRFEKHTTSGDKIEIDNQVYVVQRSKCQYKYAGAQKFVMVRKILQVKPLQRAMQEDYIMRQWNAAPAPDVE